MAAFGAVFGDCCRIEAKYDGVKRLFSHAHVTVSLN